MESQTVTLILGAIVVLVIVNFLFLDDSSSVSEHGRSRRDVVVTANMVESVRAVAPGLTTAQIRADLHETGSVQLTVERYLGGALVPEEGSTGMNTGTDTTSCGTGVANRAARSGSVKTGSGVNSSGVSQKGQDGPFGGLTFDEKKREMIMENRRRLEKKRGCEFAWS